MTRNERYFLGLVASALVVWTVFLLVATSPLSVEDDAFIAFRYAQNFARGEGLVFNPGERYWGFTSPLHTMLLGIAGAVGLDIVRTAIVLGVFATAGAGMIVGLLVRPVVGIYGGAFVATALLASMRALWYPGLETALLLFLLTATLWLTLAGRATAAAFVGALACLTRPDAMVFVLPLAILVPALRRPRPALAFALPGVAWIGFAWVYYGDWLPLTFAAKHGSSTFRAYFLENLRWIGGFAQDLWYTYDGWTAVLGIGLAASALAVAELRRRPALLFAFTAYPLLLLSAYATIGSEVMHRWEIFAAAYFLEAGALTAVVYRARRFCRRGTAARTAVALAAVAFVAVAGRTSVHLVTEMAPTAYWKGARQRAFREAADWMRAHWPRGVHVASQEVGTLAYYSDKRFWDRYFLVRPRNAVFPAPDYAVLWTTDPTVKDFGRTFRLVHFVQGPGFQPLGLYVAEPKGVALSPGPTGAESLPDTFWARRETGTGNHQFHQYQRCRRFGSPRRPSGGR